MFDLSTPWPAFLNRRTVLPALLGFVLLLFALSFVDAPLSVWAQALPAPVVEFFAYITDYGLSDWILYPSALSFLVCAGLARVMPKLTPRVALKQMAAIFGFIFVGVGLPGLVSNLAKRVIGRGRPKLLDQVGTLDFHNLFNDFTYQSFPSGHATTAFAFGMVVSFLSPRLLKPMLVISVPIAISRIVVGAHYPTDVLGGVVLGTVGAYLVRNFFATRGWVFQRGADGRIRLREPAAVRRLIRGQPKPVRK